MRELQAGVYEHYKGKRYLALGVARHSETGESMAVYVPLYDVDGPQMAVRPIGMFLGNVEIEGMTVPRFRFIGKTAG